ncbi:MAG: aminopeptidase P family protein [Nitrososphaerota archaeon]|nr:aminopeptidase P family protein [Nitrososphaerota archaeon]
MRKYEDVRSSLDSSVNFSDFPGSPYYKDAVYPRFSEDEYGRRYSLVREYMRKNSLDAMIVCGGPNHWSSCYGMGWLTNHTKEWHGIANYLVVSSDEKDEPTLVYSMGGSHIEATRRAVVVNDVRPSKAGKFHEVIITRLKEIAKEEGNIGVSLIDPRFKDYMPYNQFSALKESLPKARFTLLPDIFHEFWCVKSQEEIEVMKRAGEICDKAIKAMAEAAKPGVKEYELRAEVAYVMHKNDADFTFIIIGSTPMSSPAQFFGNPRPSSRSLQKGDLILNEISVEYRGLHVQIGTPILVGKPTPRVEKFWKDIVKPGFEYMLEGLRPGVTLDDISKMGKWYRDHGSQSRPLLLHGLGVSSERPECGLDRIEAEPYERTLKPGMTLMLEPNAITLDGDLGMFVGRSYVITDKGYDALTKTPIELIVA